MPTVTVYLIALGQTVHHYFPFIVLGIAAVVLVAWKWKNSESGAEKLDQIRLKLPVLGSIWLKYQIAMFARMMSTLLPAACRWFRRWKRRGLPSRAVRWPLRRWPRLSECEKV